MKIKTDTSPRRNFLKSIPLAMVSIGALSLFSFKKSNSYSEVEYTTLSKSEADELIRKQASPVSEHLRPAPAPTGEKVVKG